MEKIILGLFVFLTIFLYKPALSFAACTAVPSNQTTCTGTQTTTCSQPRPPAGNISRWCCDNQESCDTAKGIVQQQITDNMAKSSDTSVGPSPAPLSALEDVFGNVVKTILSLGGIVLFIMLLSGGFKYLTSGGDPKAVEGAKNTLTYAIGGFVLLAFSYLILVTIGTFTGTGDILKNFVIFKQP